MKAVVRPGSVRQPAPKESKKKKTLKEVAGSMLMDMGRAKREERLRPTLEREREMEDEVAALTFGPSWRERSKFELVPLPPDSEKDLVG